jgi:chemotaxis protein methyltransferase CheR
MSKGLSAVAELVRRETGIVVKDSQLPALAAALERVAPGLGPERFVAEASATARNGLLHSLVDEVTVQETYFFRELRELKAIDWRLLLTEAKERGFGSVRVWTAACATGEEAYSLAILAAETLGLQRPPVTILATDISTAALERAAAGDSYSERSVRNLPPQLRERYLSREKSGFRVKDHLRSLVRFRHHNLIGDPSPPLGETPFDVIACRNVLIYFDPPTIEQVFAALESALRPEGRLVLGAADRLTTAGRLGRVDPAPPQERRRPPKRSLRRPLGRQGDPRRRAQDRIEDALLAADAGEDEEAMKIVEALVSHDPLMADAYFLRGLLELEREEPAAATVSLRRCLYLDPSFGLAAFQLGRAHDASGDVKAARRTYAQALRTLDPDDERHRAILDQVDLGDVAAACAARLRAKEEAR